MASFMKLNLDMKKDIMAAVNKAGSIDRPKLIAEVCLKYGFTERTVNKMLTQMDELGYIKAEGLVITKGEAHCNNDEE